MKENLIPIAYNFKIVFSFKKVLTRSFSYYLIFTIQRSCQRKPWCFSYLREKWWLLLTFRKGATASKNIICIFPSYFVLSSSLILFSTPHSPKGQQNCWRWRGMCVHLCISFSQQTTSLAIYMPLKFYQVLYNLSTEYFITS